MQARTVWGGGTLLSRIGLGMLQLLATFAAGQTPKTFRRHAPSRLWH